MERESSSGSVKIHIAELNLSVPQEIVEDILSRLPVKSLLKFRCVSKSWRSLIDSERFIKIHLKKSTENPWFSHHRIIFQSRNKLLWKCNWSPLVEESIVEEFEFDTKVKLIGCCNGVVCLVDERGIFTLWNPSTKMSLDLPISGGVDFHMYGFGYDELSDDYKVFVVMTPSSNISHTHAPVGRVYRLRSHTWETLEASIYPSGMDKSGKFVSGNLHWLGYKDGYEDEESEEDEEVEEDEEDEEYEEDEGDEEDEEDEEYKEDEDRKIVTFDLKNDSYGMVEQPSCQNYIISRTRTLGVIDGCLSVFCGYPDSHFNIWVMKDYGVRESWINLYRIPSFNHPSLRGTMVRSFYVKPKEEVLLIYKSTLLIYCYNLEDEVFNYSRIMNINGIVGGGVYVQSLVSLGPYAEADDADAEQK